VLAWLRQFAGVRSDHFTTGEALVRPQSMKRSTANGRRRSRNVGWNGCAACVVANPGMISRTLRTWFAALERVMRTWMPLPEGFTVTWCEAVPLPVWVKRPGAASMPTCTSPSPSNRRV
jgi:hypothetical protein